MTPQNELEKLPETFMGRGDMKGISFTLIVRTEKVVMYKLDYGDNYIKYEVVIPSIGKKMDWSGNKPVPIEGCFKEGYPSSNEFGLSGKAFAFSDYQNAVKKFELLNSQFSE